MPRLPLTEADDWELEESNQDIRGQRVKDAAGMDAGTVKETDAGRVDSAVLENGREIPIENLELRTGYVVVHDPVSRPAAGYPRFVCAVVQRSYRRS